jgi:hypothetical protein
MMLALLLTAILSADTTGAWPHVREDGTAGTLIVADGHFFLASSRRDPARVTYAGSDSLNPETVSIRSTRRCTRSVDVQVVVPSVTCADKQSSATALCANPREM